MRVSLEIPEPKSSGLDAALAKQFADIQRQLMGLVSSQRESQASSQASLLGAMKQQQISLLHAFESLMGMVRKSVDTARPSDALAGALMGLKHVLSDLPGDLRGALDRQYQSLQPRLLSPSITVRMPERLTTRLDALQDAVVNGLRRSRNRTFGSNY